MRLDADHEARDRSRRAAGSGSCRLAVLALGLLAMIAGGMPAAAIDLERMVMPGPLARSHAKLEKDCASCHQAFDVEAQRTLCLACHETVKDDLDRHVGFHGKSALASEGQCRTCHPDHMGRDADILGGGASTFDHAQTDFPLVGRHEATPCAGCHPAKSARRDAPGDCFACHEKDDKHAGALTKDCAQCHDAKAWTSTRFDHAKTEYPLTGAHAKASCNGCHAGERYAETPKDCVSCHALDDKHAGRFGTECADCHDTLRWKKQGFDHARESGFPLIGAHGTATCASCHREAPGKRKLPETCAACHAREDVHAGRFGEDCRTCHTATRWQDGRFDHGTKTDFDLQGAHARIACNTCHPKAVGDVEMATDCHSCHRKDDVHRATLGKDCAECHGAESFSSQVRFDHDLTGFPLLGLHAIAACESCHADRNFQQSKVDCRSCHADQDVHEKTMGSNCEGCHNPNGWSIWQFDHDKQTEFTLSGAHAGLECAGCHRTPVAAGVHMATTCIGCHASEDAHRGGFGRGCESCHSDQAWKPARFGKQGRLER